MAPLGAGYTSVSKIGLKSSSFTAELKISERRVREKADLASAWGREVRNFSWQCLDLLGRAFAEKSRTLCPAHVLPLFLAIEAHIISCIFSPICVK